MQPGKKTSNNKSIIKRLLGRFEHWQIIAGCLIVYDFIAVCAAYFLALLIRFDGKYSAIYPVYISAYNHFILFAAVGSIVIFLIFRMYSGMWRFASFSELVRTFFGSLSSSILHTVLITVLFRRMMLYAFSSIRFTYKIFRWQFFKYSQKKRLCANNSPHLNDFQRK